MIQASFVCTKFPRLRCLVIGVVEILDSIAKLNTDI
jgi:hypothetical protein